MNKDIRVNVAKTLNISPSAFFEGEVKHFGGDGAMIPFKKRFIGKNNKIELFY